MNHNIKVPTIKQLLKLEHWALVNNLFVHPEYIKATKRKNKLLVAAGAVGTILTVIIVKAIILTIIYLTR